MERCTSADFEEVNRYVMREFISKWPLGAENSLERTASENMRTSAIYDYKEVNFANLIQFRSGSLDSKEITLLADNFISACSDSKHRNQLKYDHSFLAG